MKITKLGQRWRLFDWKRRMVLSSGGVIDDR